MSFMEFKSSVQMSVLLVLALGLIPACRHAVNPWRDDLTDVSSVTTPSEERARQVAGSPSHHVRGFARADTRAQSGEVTHWPLWWENPTEDRGSDDGRFAVTGEDYLSMPYSWGRNLVNFIGFPVSLALQPPWRVMCSDGYASRQALGYDHDAVEAGDAPAAPSPQGPAAMESKS